jgi:hypothetical protein
MSRAGELPLVDRKPKSPWSVEVKLLQEQLSDLISHRGKCQDGPLTCNDCRRYEAVAGILLLPFQ